MPRLPGVGRQIQVHPGGLLYLSCKRRTVLLDTLLLLGRGLSLTCAAAAEVISPGPPEGREIAVNRNSSGTTNHSVLAMGETWKSA